MKASEGGRDEEPSRRARGSFAERFFGRPTEKPSGDSTVGKDEKPPRAAALQLVKRVSDPVHNTIGLTGLEQRVVDSQAFQRLRRVGQLGLADMVFPALNYSRFSHSLGVCHLCGRILGELNANGTLAIDAEDIQLYRLAGLLHDTGHYPFSHAMERAVTGFYKSQQTLQAGAGDQGAPVPSGEAKIVPLQPVVAPPALKHEDLGREVCVNDPELSHILKDVDIDRVWKIIRRQEPFYLSNLVSSDMDADRIDFLLRTSHHAGLPYGSIDLEYLISQMRYDEPSGLIYLTHRALRAAEHFLLSRFFDYQTVAFHKTVVGFELVLNEVIASLLAVVPDFDFNTNTLTDDIKSGAWRKRDDRFVLEAMRRAVDEGVLDHATTLKASAILARRPPRIVGQREQIVPQDNQPDFAALQQLTSMRLPEVAAEFGLEVNQFSVWSKEAVRLTKVGYAVPLPALHGGVEDEEDEFQQLVRIQDTNGEIRTIVELSDSMMRVMSNSVYYGFRVFVTLSPEQAHLRADIERQLMHDVPQLRPH